MSNQTTIDQTLGFEPLATHGAGSVPYVPSLGIIWHPDHTRIGEVAPLLFGNVRSAELSRLTPTFYGTGKRRGHPLLDRHISRSALTITRVGHRSFEFSRPESRMRIEINGRILDEPMTVTLDEYGADIIITLSETVVLSLFERPVERSDHAATAGLIGISGALARVWQTTLGVASTDLPVLITGETGVGKELVAQAVHSLSPRANGPILSVNMATLGGDLAAAELFGSSKGAFTGAERDRPGLFEQAQDGTLFLDEIGNTPDKVQPMLLRVLEGGEFRRVGDTVSRNSKARIIAATDQDLTDRGFNQPLMRRLKALDIHIPALRHRRADIGLLAKHFASTTTGSSKEEALSILSGAMLAQMALHDWPGNVRELRSWVQQIIVAKNPTSMDLRRSVSNPPQKPQKPMPAHTSRRQYLPAHKVSTANLLNTLDECDWCIKEAAKTLGISRSALYRRMETCKEISKVSELTDAEIRQVSESGAGDISDWARQLRVSRTSLQKRIHNLCKSDE